MWTPTWCVLIWSPSPHIYRREPRAAWRPSAANPPRTDLGDLWGGDTWLGWGSGVHGPGRPICRSVGMLEAPTALSFVQQAVLGLLVLTPWVLACPKLVCLGAWACFDPIEPDSCSLIGGAFYLDLWSVFPCSWSVFSPLIHQHTNIYQHSWKWSVINPYHYVDVCISCVYAGVDGLNLVLKSRQQLPHT